MKFQKGMSDVAYQHPQPLEIAQNLFLKKEQKEEEKKNSNGKKKKKKGGRKRE